MWEEPFFSYLSILYFILSTLKNFCRLYLQSHSHAPAQSCQLPWITQTDGDELSTV